MKKYIKILVLSISLVFKVFWFFVLLYQGIDLTYDYLKFPSTVKLTELNNRKDFKLPAIQVCTGLNHILDRNKVISYFNLTEDFIIFLYSLNRMSKELMDMCLSKTEYKVHCDDYLKKRLSRFSVTFDLRVFGDRFHQINESYSKFMIKASDYFLCSGEAHNQIGSNKIIINNCEKYTEVIETTHGNDLGVCFTYFSDRKSLTNNSLTLKDKDFIQFEISSIKLENIMFLNKIIINGDFFLFWSIHDSNTFTIPKRSDLFQVFGVGVFLEVKYLRTTVKYLPWPYKSDCHHFDSKCTLSCLISGLHVS